MSIKNITLGRNWIAVVALVVIAVLGGRASSSFAAADATAPAMGTFAQINHLPNIPLLDQFGHPASLAALKGKPVLIGFIHTDCQGPCELLTAKMKSIADSLDPSFGSKVTMVSITTDPAEDHPQQLAAYAKAQGAEGPGWVFLTGKPVDVGHVLNIYGIPHSKPDDAMTHVSELHLIAADGREIRQYNGPTVKPEVVASDIKSVLARR